MATHPPGLTGNRLLKLSVSPLPSSSSWYCKGGIKIINSSSKKSSSVSVVVVIVVFLAVGGHPPTRPFRPFETLRNRAYLSNHISPPSRPSLTAPSTSGGFSIFHFSAVLAPNGSARPPSRSSPGGREEEGRGGKGREGKKCFCRPHNRQFFQHFPLFGRFSAERKRTPPPNPAVSVSNAPFSPRNSFSALIFGRKRIFDPTFGQFSTFIFWGPPSGLVREASRAGSSSNPVAQPFSVQPASLGNFVIDFCFSLSLILGEASH